MRAVRNTLGIHIFDGHAFNQKIIISTNLRITEQRMLTKMQKTQLHKDLLEYLTNNGFPKTAEVFAEEAELPIEDVDAESNKLVFKWKSILSLQKKITNYEEQIKGLEE